MADAFGFTPEQVYQLTLPQIAAYGRYMDAKNDAREGARAGHTHTSAATDDQKRRSAAKLILLFGSPEARQHVAEGKYGEL